MLLLGGQYHGYPPKDFKPEFKCDRRELNSHSPEPQSGALPKSATATVAEAWESNPLFLAYEASVICPFHSPANRSDRIRTCDLLNPNQAF